MVPKMSKIEKLILFFVILWVLVFTLGYFSGLNAPSEDENETKNQTGEGIDSNGLDEDDEDDDVDDEEPPDTPNGKKYNITLNFTNIGNETSFSVLVDGNDVNMSVHLLVNESFEASEIIGLTSGVHHLILDFNETQKSVILDFTVKDEGFDLIIIVDEPEARLEAQVGSD